MTLDAPSVGGRIDAAGTDPITVIFIDSGADARSPMAEALLRRDGGDRFEVVSAGVTPRGVNPMAVAAMSAVGLDLGSSGSKPVGAFLGRRFDYVITLCDRARVTCPVFPGGKQTLHWGLDDPSEVEGTDADRRAAFDIAMKAVARRIRTFIPFAVSVAQQ